MRHGPSQHLTFIVSIGRPIHVLAQTDVAQAPARYDFVLGGLQASSALIAYDGDQEGVASAGKDDSAFGRRAPGNDSVYVVCDDPDGLFARATAAGAQVVRGLSDEDYGSRGFTVRDPDGNVVNILSHRAEG